MRREGGARQNASDRVLFQLPDGRTVEGWMLNVSRGGLRAIVEDPLERDVEVDVLIGEALTGRPARIVWVKAEKGGSVVGVAFLDTTSAPPPPPDPDGC